LPEAFFRNVSGFFVVGFPGLSPVEAVPRNVHLGPDEKAEYEYEYASVGKSLLQKGPLWPGGKIKCKKGKNSKPKTDSLHTLHVGKKGKLRLEQAF